MWCIQNVSQNVITPITYKLCIQHTNTFIHSQTFQTINNDKLFGERFLYVNYIIYNQPIP